MEYEDAWVILWENTTQTALLPGSSSAFLRRPEGWAGGESGNGCWWVLQAPTGDISRHGVWGDSRAADCRPTCTRVRIATWFWEVIPQG